ncbi:MAG TPA: hypothetical protein VNU68_19110 [Verrucomicrobiae bacterium]|nr:hypothetical protein [Verrucomicrobiae bacterium]
MRTKPTTNTPEPASGIKKVSFGAIGAKKEAKKTTEYPAYPDANGAAAEIAARILERTEQWEALDSAIKTDKAELKQMVSPFYFTTNSGKVEVPSSVSVASEKGEVLVTYQNRYTKIDSEALLNSVPFAKEYFRQAFTLEIDGDKIPAEAVEELIAELQELFGKHNAMGALAVKDAIKPVAEFHTLRHSKLTPEQNLALDQIVPIVAMVKTKGRGK